MLKTLSWNVSAILPIDYVDYFVAILCQLYESSQPTTTPTKSSAPSNTMKRYNEDDDDDVSYSCLKKAKLDCPQHASSPVAPVVPVDDVFRTTVRRHACTFMTLCTSGK